MNWATAPLFMSLPTIQLVSRPFFGLPLITLAIKKGGYMKTIWVVFVNVCISTRGSRFGFHSNVTQSAHTNLIGMRLLTTLIEAKLITGLWS